MRQALLSFFTEEVCLKKRGGYAGNLEKQIKVRVARETYERLQRLAEETDRTVARVVRGLISAGLESRETF